MGVFFLPSKPRNVIYLGIDIFKFFFFVRDLHHPLFIVSIVQKFTMLPIYCLSTFKFTLQYLLCSNGIDSKTFSPGYSGFRLGFVSRGRWGASIPCSAIAAVLLFPAPTAQCVQQCICRAYRSLVSSQPWSRSWQNHQLAVPPPPHRH